MSHSRIQIGTAQSETDDVWCLTGRHDFDEGFTDPIERHLGAVGSPGVEAPARFGVEYVVERRDRVVQISDGVHDVVCARDPAGMCDRVGRRRFDGPNTENRWIGMKFIETPTAVRSEGAADFPDVDGSIASTVPM